MNYNPPPPSGYGPPPNQQQQQQQQQQQYQVGAFGIPSGGPPNSNPPSYQQQQQFYPQPGAPGLNSAQPTSNFMPPGPSSSYGPPGTSAPVSYGPPGTSAPVSSYGPPGTSAPVGGMGPSSAKPVQFYSTGAPNVQAPVTAVPSMGPPSSFGGIAPPPSFGGIAPPPSSMGGLGPPTMPPPPIGAGAPMPGQPQFISAPPGTMPGVIDPSVPSYPGQMYGAPPPNSNIGLPSQFDSSGYLPGAVGADGNQSSAPLPTLAELDLSVKCNPKFMRSTVGKIVNSQAAANASRLPIGVNIRPMAGDKGIVNDEIEVIDFGTTGIVRCKRCRTYVNPFVSWIDSGRRWRCNICGMQNDTPNSYFSHLDANGQRRDKDERPELSKCSVEFVAPGDYMVRPPQPPVYFFVIDVSSVSIASGMLQSCVNAIKASLDELPGAPRTQIGFITFDTSIHFYNLKSTLAAPQMLVVPDITDIILPLPEDLLVNLQESRSVVDALLDSLPGMFRNNTAVNTCTGPALTSAKNVMGHIGGKLCLFQSSLPTIGEGALKPRDNPRLLGTDKEHTMLNAEEAWYKNNAIDFSRLQIAVDCFLFSGQYTDLATISVLSKYSGGAVHYYPGFSLIRDGVKFERELHHDLTRATAFEAVMRVRATRGLRITNFYGNYFIRGTDLLALPNCTSDSTFGLDIAYDETILSAQAITVQAALLYTSSGGERRIRVHTMLIPVVNSVSDMVDSLDIDCAVNLIAKQVVDIAGKTGMDNARQRVHQAAVEIIRATKGGQMGFQQPGMPQSYHYQQQQVDTPVPTTLQLLPLYAMSLQKSLVLRGGNEVRIDERAYFHNLVQNIDIDEGKVFIYPRMFSIHDMTEDSGLPCDNADIDCPTAGPFRVRLPALLNLSSERLVSDGMFLLENGYEMFMWIGRTVNPAIISTLFGTPSLDGVDMTSLAILADNSDFSSRVNAVIVALRQDRSRYMHLHFVREGDGYAEAYFARYLVEDRANFPVGQLSYTEYHTHVSRQVAGMPG